ncbi:GSCOCG00012730001-RA-CDS [Cotesia congregata]|nr:GSCOCG00012730001-RA-CDS [Cotesia congregata]
MQTKYPEIVYTVRDNLPTLNNSKDSWEELEKIYCNVPEIRDMWSTRSADNVPFDSQTESYLSLQKNNKVNNKALEILSISLKKDLIYEDFGFSVSDGLYEKGIYINRLRPGGPCDGVLKPYDRIIKINTTCTEDYDCCLAVPLVAATGDELNLIIARLTFSEIL